MVFALLIGVLVGGFFGRSFLWSLFVAAASLCLVFALKLAFMLALVLFCH